MRLLILLIYKILEYFNTYSDEKLIKSFKIDGIRVSNENGWTEATHIHMTKPFEIYKLVLDNGSILECADDHIVFVSGFKEKYVKDLTVKDKVITKYGEANVSYIEKLGTTIHMCDMTVNNARHSYYTNDVLSHNTTTSAIFMLHYILFNIDKNALVLGNKRKTAVEVLEKSKKIFLEIPFFLKPGIYKWNEAEIVLDNGCRLMCEATTVNSGIGFTFHCVLADEFGHLAPNIMEPFYNNLFPTITAARARFMITSTQNGYNLFYRLYMSAVAGDNEYKPFKTDWDEVPEWNPDKRCWEKRDEAWHRLQVANYGSEEAFNAQFGTSFDVSAKTLVNRKKLQKKKSDLIEFVEKDLYGVPHSDCYVWHPNYEPMSQLKKDYIVITVDLAEGSGGDYTVATLYRMANRDSDDLECVGYFRSNKTLREHFSLSLQTLICKYLNLDRTLLSYEKNTYGELFYRDLMDNMEKDKLISRQFDPSILVKYYNDSGTKFVHGIKMTSGNKSSHCILFKESYERDKIINNDTRFYNELLTFIDDGTGHFKASVGHDDLMMASIQLEFVKSTLQYKIMRGEFGSGVEIVEQDENIYNPFENTWWLDQMEQDMNSTRTRLASF